MLRGLYEEWLMVRGRFVAANFSALFTGVKIADAAKDSGVRRRRWQALRCWLSMAASS